jgi:hypothetical protein
MSKETYLTECRSWSPELFTFGNVRVVNPDYKFPWSFPNQFGLPKSAAPRYQAHGLHTLVALDKSADDNDRRAPVFITQIFSQERLLCM